MDATSLDYALLAGAAYDDRRDTINRIPYPLTAQPLAGSLESRNLSSGFEGRAYQYNGKIVISYAGIEGA